MDAEWCGKPLREQIEPSLHAYVRSSEARGQRLVMVRSAADIPWHLHLAASCLGARVCEDLLVPLLHFQEMVGFNIAFTQPFAEQHKEVVAVARSASLRTPYYPGRAPHIRVHRRKRFLQELAKVSKKEAASRWSLIYAAGDDVTSEEAACARLFPEFLRWNCAFVKA